MAPRTTNSGKNRRSRDRNTSSSNRYRSSGTTSDIYDNENNDPDKIQLNYSGHRGYHIRIHDPKVYSLDSNARIEIVHYVLGSGFRGDKAIISQRGGSLIPSRDIPGWSGKVADAMVEFIQNIDTYTGREKWVKPLIDKKIVAIDMLQRQRPVLSAKVKGVGIKSWPLADRREARFFLQLHW